MEGPVALSAPSAADSEDGFSSTAGFEPLIWGIGSSLNPFSFRILVLDGDGEGSRDLLIQDFRARFEIGPAIEGALRSVLCNVPPLLIWGSSVESCEDGSGPMVNLGTVGGLSVFLSRLIEPSRLKVFLRDFKPSSNPFFVEA